jgi:poly(A) polymerase
LADTSGRIYDPLGQGLADLRAGHVVFVGDAAQRVAEDYLRILRFFRFHARYGRGLPDDSALAACRAAADKIAILSRERVTDEFMKILAVDDPAAILRLMSGCGVLTGFAHADYQETQMNRLVLLQKQGRWPDAVARLAVLTAFMIGYINILQQRLVLSNEMKKNLALYTTVAAEPPGAREAKLWIYRHGPAAARQMVMLGLARVGREKIAPDSLEILQGWEAPALPVSGDDIMAAGIAEGPEVGTIRHKIETWWIENDYAPDRDSCLRKLAQLTTES